jgi:hypothetical protein
MSAQNRRRSERNGSNTSSRAATSNERTSCWRIWRTSERHEPVSLDAGGIAFEAESRDDFFWKARKPSARKNFYCYQTFLIKRGWVLTLVTPD